MSAPEVQVGEVVDITIKGARVAPAGGMPNTLFVRFVDDAGTLREVGLPDSSHVTVERVGPPEWPPQVGDLWRGRDGLYFAADIHEIDETDQPKIVMVWTYEDYRTTPDKLLQHEGPLTLVHREDTEGGEPR